MKYHIIVFSNEGTILHDVWFTSVNDSLDWADEHYPNWSVKDKWAGPRMETWEVWVN